MAASRASSIICSTLDRSIDRSHFPWLPADRYEYVVVDEFHHAVAPSYQRLLDHVRPRVLLGLTATPERSDELDVLKYFDGHMSAQIRLPDAINRKLLSPFQYFAVTDSEDLSGLKWQRGGYPIEELDRIYTGPRPARFALVIDKVRSILATPGSCACGAGFCVSVDVRNREIHLLRSFSSNWRSGIPAEALSAIAEVVKAVLFLRPTESLTVFLQQLGRGLRLDPEKECLTVLDFVGHAHRNFRFDLRYRALLTDASVSLERQVEHGFTHLPAGCTIVMERVALDEPVLESHPPEPIEAGRCVARAGEDNGPASAPVRVPRAHRVEP